MDKEKKETHTRVSLVNELHENLKKNADENYMGVPGFIAFLYSYYKLTTKESD